MSRCDLRRQVAIAAAVLAASQVVAAMCGCVRREPPLVESAPAKQLGWADPVILVQHHPLWGEYAQLRASEESAQPAPAQDEMPAPALPETRRVGDGPAGGTDLDDWRDTARRITRGPDRPTRAPEDWAPAHAAEEADAKLAADREAIGAETQGRARQAERDVADGRVTHSDRSRVDALMARINAPPDDTKAAQEAAEIRGDPDEWTRRKARDEEARIRAEAARDLRAAELERDASVLRSAIDARSREPRIDYDTPSERKNVADHVRAPSKPHEEPASLDTQRMARRERELAAQATALRRSFDEAAERRRGVSRAELDALYKQLIQDTRAMAFSLAQTRGIDLAFEPTEGRADLTAAMVDLLDEVYTSPIDDADAEAEPTE